MLEWLDTLLPRLLQATIGLSIAAVAVQVLLWFFRTASPGWHRTAWFVVLAQGLIFVRLPFSIPWYGPSRAAPRDHVPNPNEGTSHIQPGAGAETRAKPASMDVEGPKSPMAASPKSADPWPWRRWAVLSWLAGVLSLPLAWLWTYVRFVRRFPAAQHADDDWLREWRDLLVQRGIRRRIPLVVTSTAGPALCLVPSGYRVLVPQHVWRAFDPDQRLAILRHELAHYERNDVFKSLAARLLALVHWFNPCVWWIVRKVDVCAEWSCDQVATAGDGQAATRYAKALLTLGEARAGGAGFRPAAQGSELSSRIQRLLLPQFEKGSPMKKLVFVAVMTLLAIGGLLRFKLVARASQPEPGAADEKSAAAVGAPTQDRIAVGDLLRIQADNVFPGHPIDGLYKVEASGKVALGLSYKRVVVAGATLEEAEDIITDHLRTMLRDPIVSVTRALLKSELLDEPTKKHANESLDAFREGLRYDGATFAEWKRKLQIDLKPERRVDALKALGRFGANGFGNEVAVVIDEFLNEYRLDNDTENRIVLAEAMVALRRIGAPAVGVLLRELKLWRGEHRTAVTIATLSDLGPTAQPAVAELMSALRDERHAKWRPSLIEAIAKIDPSAEGFFAVLVEATTEGEPFTAQSAIAVLSRLDQDDDAKVRALIGAMKHKDREVRRVSIVALRDMGSKAAAAVPALTEAIADEDSNLRSYAEWALEQIQDQADSGKD
jgi:beta-lactamase regulating signal transducer with metallopeptidase domain